MIHLVHGFNVWDRGRNTVGRIRPHIDGIGLECNVLSYPWTGLLTLRTNNRWAVEELRDRVQPGDGVIAHSNGCWIAVQAAELGAPLEWLILVNPALHPRHEMPGQLRSIYVYHSPGDIAVRAGKVWSFVTRIFPWRWFDRHPWGDMGEEGYIGTDPRVQNVAMPGDFRHSGVWSSEPWLEDIAALADRLEAEKAPLQAA